MHNKNQDLAISLIDAVMEVEETTDWTMVSLAKSLKELLDLEDSIISLSIVIHSNIHLCCSDDLYDIITSPFTVTKKVNYLLPEDQQERLLHIRERKDKKFN